MFFYLLLLCLFTFAVRSAVPDGEPPVTDLQDLRLGGFSYTDDATDSPVQGHDFDEGKFHEDSSSNDIFIRGRKLEVEVKSRIFEASIDLKALINEEDNGGQSPPPAIVDIMSMKCFNQQPGSSWNVKFIQDYASCLIHLRGDDGSSDQPETGVSNYNMGNRCHRFISKLTSRVNLNHWACAPYVMCEIAKLTKTIPSDTHCTAQSRCWVYIKGSRFWNDIVLNYGKRFKSLMDAKNFWSSRVVAYFWHIREQVS